MSIYFSKDFKADIVTRIDKTGRVYKVEFLMPTAPVYKQIIENKLIGAQFTPFVYLGENVNSFKMYKIKTTTISTQYKDTM